MKQVFPRFVNPHGAAIFVRARVGVEEVVRGTNDDVGWACDAEGGAEWSRVLLLGLRRGVTERRSTVAPALPRVWVRVCRLVRGGGTSPLLAELPSRLLLLGLRRGRALAMEDMLESPGCARRDAACVAAGLLSYNGGREDTSV
mmetsp:Transcript_36725/g.69123  ORF Transcript_36725/g.69123 Transcript_36725/m.69123 type:complete len:144 (-) Transcript_36725:398-829(-)